LAFKKGQGFKNKFFCETPIPKAKRIT